MWSYIFSLRLLKSRKKRSVFSPMTLVAICGIAFGMAATLLSLSVITGFQKAYEEAILGFNAHIVLIQEGEIDDVQEALMVLRNFHVTDEEERYWDEHSFSWKWFGRLGLFRDKRMDELSQKGVRSITPFIFREGLGVLPDAVTSVVLKGVDPSVMREMYPLRFSFGARRSSLVTRKREQLVPTDKVSEDPIEVLTLRQDELPPVIVGFALYERFFPDGPSDKAIIRLLVPKRTERRHHIREYAQNFRVVGTFESGLQEFDSQFILTSLEVMDRLFNLEGMVSGFEIVLDDRFKAPHLARVIEPMLPGSYQAISWDELNEPLFSAMKMEKTLFVVIMFLIVLIASFNVMGVILMLILNRQDDIAILRAQGATVSSIRRSFALQGLFLGAIGVIFGSIVSGLALWSLETFRWFDLDAHIYFVSHLPVAWPKALWIAVIAISLLICYLVSQLATRFILKYGSLTQSFR